MTTNSRARVIATAVAVASLAFLLVAAGLALVELSGPAPRTYRYWADGGIAGAAFLAVGWLVVARRPYNPVGWLLLAIGALTGPQMLAGQYATSIGARGVPAAAWTEAAVRAATLPLLAFLLLLFPTGRLPSPRWRWIAWGAGAGTVLYVPAELLRPGRMAEFPLANPLGVRSALVPLALAAGQALLAAGLLAGIAGLGLRAVRSAGEQRQQVKWLALAVLVSAIVIATLNVLLPGPMEGGLGTVVWGLAFSAVPCAVGVAVLRYRLYDIDRIVSRTVAYGLVTGLLLAVYAGAVVVLNTLLPLADDSPVTVAAATLAAAAAFNPLRRRVQAAVDRRFNRARYDAARTVEAFGARLRDATDPDALAADLLTAVRASVQPARTALWLR